VHKLCWLKIFVGIKKRLTGQSAFAVLVVAVYVPLRVATIRVVAYVVRYIGNNQLRPRDVITFEVLKVIID
jgi:hypothetical protein